MTKDKPSKLEKVLIGIILALMIAMAFSCNPEEPPCYKVVYEDGIEISREVFDGVQKDTLFELIIKSWFEHYDGHAVRKQVTYETYVECN